MHHPSILKDVIKGKNSDEIRAKVRSLDVKVIGLGKEVPNFIPQLKTTSPHHIDPNDKPKLNRLCYVEDSENSEQRNNGDTFFITTGFFKKILGMGTCDSSYEKLG